MNTAFDYSDFTPSATPQVFDKIELLSDKGSTSITFVARMKGKDYFLKRLRPELQGLEEYRQLFRKEFELGQKLDSPYIAKYCELKDDEAGTYILRENVIGCTLEEKLKAAPEYFLKQINLNRFILQLCQALQHMHECQMVHADLKPQNIMLTHINNDVKVIDFGFSFSDSHTSSMGFSRAFAAPEQKNGKKVDARTDIYALGLLVQHIYKAIGKRMSRRMATLVGRCTAVSPDARFQRAEEVSEALLRPRRMLMRWTMGISALVLIAGLVFVFPNTNWGDWVVQEVKWSLSLSDSDFRVNDGLYRYNTPDSTTLSVVGALRTNSVTLHPSLMYEGKELRVTHIAPKAFYRATHLEALYLPEGIEVIEESALEYSNIVTLNLPKSVRKIEKNAFCRMYDLVTLNINGGVTDIPLWMAAHNHKLQMVYLPESVLSIGMDAFAFCWAMQRINLPRNLKRIERGTFWHCKSLETITLPESLEHIGEYAFYHCINLKTVVCKSTTPPNICKSFNAPREITLYVPQASIKEYQNHPEWGMMKIEALRD